MRWDNITILQAVDRHQERFGGGEVWRVDGRQLMEEIAGHQVAEDLLPHGFIRELEIAAAEGYLTFNVEIYGGNPEQTRQSYPYQYRLAALHSEILAVSEQLFRDEHRAAAVFEAAKAVHNRVKKMTGLPGDGAGLMGRAFRDDQPALVLADLTSQIGKNAQAGYRFLFMGSQAAIRNPAAHEQFGELDDDEAFELLGLASHLMRRLDQVSPT